jgi:hypothetical protein
MKQMIKPRAAGIFATCLSYSLHLTIDLIFQQSILIMTGMKGVQCNVKRAMATRRAENGVLWIKGVQKILN